MRRVKVNCFFLSIFLVIFIDRLSKYFFSTFLFPEQINKGISFGWLSIFGETSVLFYGLFLLGIIIIIKTKQNVSRTIEKIVYGMIVGGGISNVLDRVFFDGVRDFLLIPIGLYFNLADCFIVLGAMILIGEYLVQNLRFVKKARIYER